MKVKIISLALAAAIGLSACHSGGVSNNQATTVSSNKLTTMAKPAAGGGQQGGISSFLLQSIFGTFAMGTLGFPGTWAASLISSVIFSWLPTQESQTTVMLKEINEKLTVVLDGLKTNLNLTASVQEITAAVYTLLTQQGITDSFTKFDDAITYVNSEYKSYTDNNIFDSNESGDQYSMYQYAQKHCDDIAVSTILESAGDSKPDNQYKLFYSTFINSDSTVGVASTYQKVINAKTAYKSAVVATLPKNNDFIKYINEYNFDITYYRWKTAGNFQKLYAMQFAQIAYHYACGNKITFTNLGNLPAKSGESGFESGIELLNSKYSSDFQQLESNMATYMPLISNSEIYTMLTTKFSKTLLNSTSFNSNANETGNCSLSNLAFNSYTNNGQTSGMIDLQAICIATKTGSESNVKYESATIALEIPYHSSNNTSIDRLGQSNIKYDRATKNSSSSVSTDALDSSDISDIFNLKPEMAFNGTYWANKESMNLLAPSWKDPETTRDSAYRFYSGFSVTPTNGVQFYSDKYTDSNPATQAEKDYKQFDSDFSYGNYVPPYDFSSFTTNSNLIQRYQYTTGGDRYWGNAVENPWDMIVGWEYWMLGDYHGKTFAIKLVFQHVALTNNWWNNVTTSWANRITAQAIGEYCLTSNCSRKDDGSGDNDTKTTLTWTDGTQVVFDETGGDDMTGLGDSSYLYKTTAAGSINK